MKKLLFNLCFLSILLPSLYAQCPSLVWSDEFEGSQLNLQNWNIQTGDGCAEGICGWGNNELQSYQAANVTVSNGSLKITAKKERVRGSQYTSGRINTKNKFDLTYGRYEARIKLPGGAGLWPAFWMLPTDEVYGGWPQSGEIDIMEFTSAQPDEVYGTIHYGDPYPNNQYTGNKYYAFEGLFTDGYHEFAIEWEPGLIRWYVDGVLYSTKTAADISPYTWPFNQNFHMLLNLAVGGNLGGPVDNSIFPKTMEVDYVRVYSGNKPGLSGPLVVANQASGKTYSLSNLSGGTSISWSVPAGATIVSGQGTASVQVNFGSSSGYVSATYTTACESKTLKMGVEVEPPYSKSFHFENFDEPESVQFSSATGSLQEVNNPAPNTVNSSARSGQYVRNSASQYDVLAYSVSNITNADAYANKDKKFYIDVYTAAPIGTEIILQLETATATSTNYPSGRHSRYVAVIEKQNQWQRLAFSLLDKPDGAASPTGITKMILLFASNTYTGDTYYFDNLDAYSAVSSSNQPPSVDITSPANGSSFSAGTSLSIAANASDTDGSISSVDFLVNGQLIATDNSAPYSASWQLTSGTHQLTARATDNGGASTLSTAVEVTGTSSQTASSVHVSAISTGTASAGKGASYGTATVTVTDNTGAAVSGATVSGNFSGTFTESKSGVTNSSGQVSLQTTGSAKGSLTVNFCVTNVSASLPYNSANNVVSCSSGSARYAPEADPNNPRLILYPNPAQSKLNLSGIVLERVEVEILNLSGQLVLRKLLAGTREGSTINVSSLAPGVYLLRLKQADLTTNHRFVKQ